MKRFPILIKAFRYNSKLDAPGNNKGNYELRQTVPIIIGSEAADCKTSKIALRN
jgi:hypothetical protein